MVDLKILPELDFRAELEVLVNPEELQLQEECPHGIEVVEITKIECNAHDTNVIWFKCYGCGVGGRYNQA